MSEEKVKKRRFKPKTTIVLLSIGIIVILVSAVMAADLSGFLIRNSVTPTGEMAISVTVDSVSWTNGSLLDWGPVEKATTYGKTLAISNDDPRDATISVIADGLPVGWTLAWTLNNTVIGAGLGNSGTLQLTTPGTFVDYDVKTWDMWIIATPYSP